MTAAYEAFDDNDRDKLVDYLRTLVLFPPDDTASNLNPGNPQDPANHGNINLGVLFQIPAEGAASSPPVRPALLEPAATLRRGGALKATDRIAQTDCPQARCLLPWAIRPGAARQASIADQHEDGDHEGETSWPRSAAQKRTIPIPTTDPA